MNRGICLRTIKLALAVAAIVGMLACAFPVPTAAAPVRIGPGPLVDDPAPPANPVKLIFVHHSSGENWLGDGDGGLGLALRDNTYFVSDTNYGWGPPDADLGYEQIGDHTDIGHWYNWFSGPHRDTYLAALYAESDQHAWYSRLPTDPGGENRIVILKSCYPNSRLGGNPTDPPTGDPNPLRGQDAWSEYHTVGNAKGIYNDLLAYFATRQDKLFVVITAPPLEASETDATHAANARAFNDWLVNDWLAGYPHDNVAVFDFYNVLSSNGGDPDTNDLGWEAGNHHRWWNGAVQHAQTVSNNDSAYPGGAGGGSHPTAAGNQKAASEFVTLLNVYHNRWAGGSRPTISLYLPLVLKPLPALRPTQTPTPAPTAPPSSEHCPALPPPTGPTVTVATEAELRDQALNAAPGTTIMIQSGTYSMQDFVYVLHDDIALRGASGDRDDVVLDFGGMVGGHFGLLVDADDVTIADLTIRNAADHGVSIQGRDRLLLYNLHIQDIGDQLVKVNPAGDGSEDGLLACSRLEYTTTAPNSYTNGISAHDAHRWIVRDNEWLRIRTPTNDPVPTILFWSGSSDTVVERNLLVDCYQGIAFGNASHGPADHTGGIVRNNVIYASLPHDSVVEMVHASGWLVAHNTALLLNPDGVSWGMEARYDDSQGTFAYNLTNMPLWLDRDGGQASANGNLTTAAASWFVDPAAADLHLVASATAAIDQAASLAQVPADYDGDVRPIGPAPDVGADEYGGSGAPTPTPTPTPTPPPYSDGLIQPADLVYRGAFRLPPDPADMGWEWSNWSSALTYYPEGDSGAPADGFPGSLFGVGHDWNQYVAELNIPVPVVSPGKDVNDLNTAATLQPFVDIRDGMFGEMELPRVGLAYLPALGGQTSGNLYFAWAPHLDEGATNPSHGWSKLDLSSPQPVGAWRVGDYWNYVTGDYLFDIPQAWADSYVSGRSLATGRFRDGGQGAQGPSLFAIAPWATGNPPAPGSTLPTTPLLLYGNAYEPDPPSVADYHHSDEWTGAAWLTAGSKAAVLFAGTKGTGDCWYGCADGTDQPPWPPDCDRGWWSTSFVGQLLLYDPAELAAVARGEVQTWDPQPYAVLNIDPYLYHLTSTRQRHHLGAAAFDRTRGLLYIIEPLADEDKPLIHVWGVG